MKLALFLDTETTGLPLFDEPSEDSRQPHIVQLAAQLVDLDTRQVVAGLDVVVLPDGWSIPEDVAAIHGITTERAQAIGVPEGAAIGMLLHLWSERVRIAHNEAFDARIVRIALLRHQPAAARAWKAGKSECTARLATPICAIAPTDRMRAAGRCHHKTPNLREAHQHLLGTGFEGAHGALADVRACMSVYFAIKDRETYEQEPPT